MVSPWRVYGTLEPEGLTSLPTTGEGAIVSMWRVYGTFEPEGLTSPPTTGVNHLSYWL